jgi:hypothetical protein
MIMMQLIRFAPGFLLSMALAACSSSAASDWQELDNLPSMRTFEGVWAFAPDDVWVVGAPQPELGGMASSSPTAAHFDGQQWTAVDTGVYYLASIWAFSPDNIWAAGGESVVHYDGQDWHETSLADAGARDLLAVWGSADDDIWAVGDEGFFHYDGTTWTRAANHRAQAIWGADADHVWTLGTFENYAYDGREWSPFAAHHMGDDGSLWGFGPDDVYLAGDDEALAHWNGQMWVLVEGADLIGDLNAVWGVGEGDIWAAGSAGQIAHFDGSRLVSVRHQVIGSPYLMTFRAMHGSSANDVWVVGNILGATGNRGVIFHYAGP